MISPYEDHGPSSPTKSDTFRQTTPCAKKGDVHQHFTAAEAIRIKGPVQTATDGEGFATASSQGTVAPVHILSNAGVDKDQTLRAYTAVSIYRCAGLEITSAETGSPTTVATAG